MFSLISDRLSLGIGLLACFLMLGIGALRAEDTLLFVEAQMVGGYSSVEDGAVWYSHHLHDAMQKPSLGFDLIKRFSNENRDWGMLALQYRVAYQKSSKPRFASQVYNAYFKYKAPNADIWIGSNRPATGLSSSLDNHASLLPDMTMKVFTYDRDWGIGAEHEGDLIKVSASLTNGAGMRIYNKEGNYMLAGRLGIGNLNKHNYNLGVSAVHGKVLEAMGYRLGHIEATDGSYILHDEDYIGVDGSLRYLNYDLKVDALTGSFYDQPARALLVRTGVRLFDEDRLNVEAQFLYSKHAVFENTNYSASLSYKLSPDLTMRALYDYHTQDKAYKVIAQLYYYKPFGF